MAVNLKLKVKVTGDYKTGSTKAGLMLRTIDSPKTTSKQALEFVDGKFNLSTVADSQYQ